MWYVIQTLTGKEEELVHMIREIVPSDLYWDCFVAYYERVWRKQGRSVVHIERLFPGYIFIISEYPDKLFFHLKSVPAMSKIMADTEYTFLSLEKEEVEFFQNMLHTDHIIHLSYVKTDGKDHILYVTAPLKHCLEHIIKFQYKKRYAIIQFKLLGVEKTAALGIILDEDIRQEILYGKVEAPVETPDIYKIIKREEKCSLTVGDHVQAISGTLKDLSGIIEKVNKNTVEIDVRLFGQNMVMEVPIEDLCVISYKGNY